MNRSGSNTSVHLWASQFCKPPVFSSLDHKRSEVFSSLDHKRSEVFSSVDFERSEGKSWSARRCCWRL